MGVSYVGMSRREQSARAVCEKDKSFLKFMSIWTWVGEGEAFVLLSTLPSPRQGNYYPL